MDTSATKCALLKSLAKYPLCRFFLEGCVQGLTAEVIEADLNAEPEFSVLQHFSRSEQMERLETLFSRSLEILGIPKEELQDSLEFNLKSYDIRNFESTRGLLRFIVRLPSLGYSRIRILTGKGLADLEFYSERQRWFAEVKTPTLQYGVREGLTVDKHQPESCNIAEYVDNVTRFLADGRVSRARKHLCSTREQLGPAETMIGIVLNWLAAGFFLEIAHINDIYESLRGRRPNWEHDYLQDIDCMAFLIDDKLTRICN